MKSSFLLLADEKRRHGCFECFMNLLKTLEIVVGMACNPVPFSYVKHFQEEDGFCNEYG